MPPRGTPPRDGKLGCSGSGPVGHPKVGIAIRVDPLNSTSLPNTVKSDGSRSRCPPLVYCAHDGKLESAGAGPVGLPKVEIDIRVEAIEQHLAAEHSQIIGGKEGCPPQEPAPATESSDVPGPVPSVTQRLGLPFASMPLNSTSLPNTVKSLGKKVRGAPRGIPAPATESSDVPAPVPLVTQRLALPFASCHQTE